MAEENEQPDTETVTAEEAVADVEATAEDSGVSPAFPAAGDLTSDDGEIVDQDARVRLLRDVSLKVRVELGRGKLVLRNLLRLTSGSVVELNKVAGDPLDIYVNDRLIGRGEVLVLDEKFCVRITEILTPEECLRVKTG